MQFWHISNLQQWKSKDQENTNSPRPRSQQPPHPTLAPITDNSTLAVVYHCVCDCVCVCVCVCVSTLRGRKAYRQAVANAASSITV